MNAKWWLIGGMVLVVTLLLAASATKRYKARLMSSSSMVKLSVERRDDTGIIHTFTLSTNGFGHQKIDATRRWVVHGAFRPLRPYWWTNATRSASQFPSLPTNTCLPSTSP